MKTVPRVPLVEPGTRPELAATEARLMAARGRVSLLYQVLLNSAPIAAGWEQLLTAVRQQTTVPADLRELVILRVAVLNRASFEFEAHVPHALAAGLSAAQIEAVRAVQPCALFSDREQQVLALTDAMTRDITVPPPLMAALQQAYDARGLVELVTTVAAYNMVSRLLVALDVH
ncbi:MAG: carboxymuconolactone decarboxylase family protein [Rubrivivax sp.]|nr:carboxymuconolactone decarboxylase family protein [Rubrivivax sp.]